MLCCTPASHQTAIRWAATSHLSQVVVVVVVVVVIVVVVIVVVIVIVAAIVLVVMAVLSISNQKTSIKSPNSSFTE